MSGVARAGDNGEILAQSTGGGDHRFGGVGAVLGDHQGKGLLDTAALKLGPRGVAEHHLLAVAPPRPRPAAGRGRRTFQTRSWRSSISPTN